MLRAFFAIAVVMIAMLTLQACGPGSDSAKSRKMIDEVVAKPPLGYLAGEVFGGNWLSTAGNQQNFEVLFQKSLTTESVDAECSYFIDWASTLGATQFRDGPADGSLSLIMLSGNEDQAQQTCVEVLSLGINPGIESGSEVWQMFGTYQSDGKPLGDFLTELNRSYYQAAGKTELGHNMNMKFYTMLGVTP